MLTIKTFSNHAFLVITLVFIGFIIALGSILPINIQQMSADELFVFKIIPLPYWFGLIVIVGAIFFGINNFNNKKFSLILILSSILLITCFRMVFPIIFESIPAFEPDATYYMNTANNWVQNGIDFGDEGNYHHNYPMAFLVAFVFVKLGIPLDTFFRFAPFFIYALILVLLYLLIEEIMPEENKKGSIPIVSVFLFSFSSLGYWLSVHFCPNLLGALMFFLCLYLAVRFARRGLWSIKSLLPIFISVFVLILSHHLSTLYLIITFFGFSIAFWYFKPSQFRQGALAFFILAIFTYTIWFTYGTLLYHSFFNVYAYFSGFGAASEQAVNAGLMTNLAFAIYPLFIFILFLIEFMRILQIKSHTSLFKNFKMKIREIRLRESNNSLFIFSLCFALVFVLFILGIGIPALFGVRILDVLFIGLYPLASQALIKLVDGKSSKRKILILIIIVFVVITGVFRYYSQIQRRITIE